MNKQNDKGQEVIKIHKFIKRESPDMKGTLRHRLKKFGLYDTIVQWILRYKEQETKHLTEEIDKLKTENAEIRLSKPVSEFELQLTKDLVKSLESELQQKDKLLRDVEEILKSPSEHLLNYFDGIEAESIGVAKTKNRIEELLSKLSNNDE